LDNFPVSTVVTFSYNGEPAAFFHVKYLYDIVNLFIIVESRYTISGQEKSSLFFEEPQTQLKYSPYLDKIFYVVLDAIPPRPNNYIKPGLHDWMKNVSYDAFWADNYQRVTVRHYIEPTMKAIIVCADADEIISKEVLSSLKDEVLYDSGYFRLSQKIPMHMLYYNFNWYMGSWAHPFVVDVPGYLAIDDYVQARVNQPSFLSDKSSGWHLSYFLSRESIRNKISSFPHREFDRFAPKWI
jgi:hypothetical protein